MVASTRAAVAALAVILVSWVTSKSFVCAATNAIRSSSPEDDIPSRELQVQGNLFTSRVNHCRKVTGNLYQTVSVRSILSRRAQRRHGDVPGPCGAVCAETCDHQPCRDDFLAINNNTCECNTVAVSRCGQGATCTVVVPGQNETCTCPAGFQLNVTDGACVDVDECQKSVCNRPLICVNTVGSFTCNCPRGYFPYNETFCVDVDECLPNVSTRYVVGTRQCGELLSSVDESLNPSPRMLCVRNPSFQNGSYTCGRCQPGFRGTPCTDVNECANPAVCAGHGNCTNTVGSYECSCEAGYIFVNGTCVDRDECLDNATLCNVAVSRRRNTEGSYTCKCIDGYNATADGQCVQIYNFEAYEPCVATLDCTNGLECAIKSRSDTTKVCCAPGNVSPCGGNQRCCAGAYTNGEPCPSKLDVDCRNGLECGWRGFINPTFVCCDGTMPFLGTKVCRF